MLLSVRLSSGCSFISVSISTLPLHSMWHMFVWLFTRRTFAEHSPENTVMLMSNTNCDEAPPISIGTLRRNSLIRTLCSSVTSEMTSRTLSLSPATIPAATDEAMPFIPPVFGTTTLLTFFIMLPLTSTLTLSGMAESCSLASAAAYAKAIGSVQPIAGINSSLRIAM